MARFARTPLVAIALVSLMATGCTVRFSSQRPVDGGVFRSVDYGEAWEQKVFVRREGKRAITISDADVASFTFSPHNPDEIMLTTFGGGIFRTTNQGESWGALPVPAGTYQTFLYDPVSPVIFYTATRNTVMKSIDEGQTWETIYIDTRGEGMVALEIDPNDSDVIFAGTTGGTIFKSDNSGLDWKVVATLKDALRTLYVNTENSDMLFALTTNRGIYRSTDHGETWNHLEGMKQFSGSQTGYQLSFSPYAPSTLYLASNFGLLKSPDAGETWEPIQTLLPFNSVQVRTVLVEPLDPQIIYFTVNNLLHKTEDGGKTWRTVESIPTGRLIVRAAHHPVRPGDVYLGTFEVKE